MIFHQTLKPGNILILCSGGKGAMSPTVLKKLDGSYKIDLSSDFETWKYDNIR